MIEAIHKGVRGILAVTRALSAIFLISSVAINFVNVVGRYVFGRSFAWAIEIILFLMVGAVFTGCCAVAWENRHIRMDVVLRLLPPRLAALLGLLADLVLITAAATVAVFAYPVISQLAAFDERSAAAYFPLAVPQAMVPIGYSVMAILVAVRMLTREHGDGASPGASS
ncbi:MAG TPA: TRAP transporter small permease [Stellaceae bacterium]|jgi:TRAP-type C4-dicarboxylate transport system permease small subunit